MERSPGLSISVKSILASMLLVLFTGIGFGLVSVCQVRGAYRAATDAAIATHDSAPGAAHAPDATADTRAALSRKESRAMTHLLVAGAIALVLGVAFGAFVSRRLARRLQSLAHKISLVARPEAPEEREPPLRGDEIRALERGVDELVERVTTLMHEVEAEVALAQQLEVVRTIQEHLVPPNEPINWDSFAFAGYFQPASRCGGDWWTYHGLEDGKLLIIIGDATGQGVSAAMLTAVAKASCDVARAANPDQLDVSLLLSLMNSAVCQSGRERLAMSCFASIICPETRIITYANAGHHFPYLYRVGEDRRGEFGSLMIRGTRLGEAEDSTYECKTTQLRPGDTLIWYTGGVIAGENEAGELYGEKRFRASIRQNAHLDAGDLRNAVVSDALGFFGKARRNDDITVIVGRVS